MSRTSLSVLRGGLALGSSTGITVLVFRFTEPLRDPASRRVDGHQRFGDLLVAGAAWVLVLALAWAVLVVAAALLEVASAGRLGFTAWVGCPPTVRRALLAGLGLVLVTGGGAVAAPGPAVPASPERSRFSLPVPARPIDGAPSVPRQRQVEVRPGDTLWHLARSRAREHASVADVARLVDRTYRANRRVIGPDPDLIRPGQRLHIPHQRTPHGQENR